MSDQSEKSDKGKALEVQQAVKRNVHIDLVIECDPDTKFIDLALLIADIQELAERKKFKAKISNVRGVLDQSPRGPEALSPFDIEHEAQHVKFKRRMSAGAAVANRQVDPVSPNVAAWVDHFKKHNT